MDISEKLSNYITDEFIEDKQASIAYREDILNTGIIDSIGMIRLVNFIEQEFNIQVLSEDMTFDNFRNIERITDYVKQNNPT